GTGRRGGGGRRRGGGRARGGTAGGHAPAGRGSGLRRNGRGVLGPIAGWRPGRRRAARRVPRRSRRRSGPPGGSGVLGAEVLVVLDVLGARGEKDPLAAADLGGEGFQRALGEVPVEVAHHAHGVRQPYALLERRPALVVDQHEGHLVGA